MIAAVHLLAVDGNSLGHRAWHALGGGDGAAADPGGRDTRGGGQDITGQGSEQRPWVAHGVVRMLASAWSYGPFDGVVVALDGPDSLRKRRYPDYKANRPTTDPALHEQLDCMADLLAAAGMTVARADGYEADDHLATVVRAAREVPARVTLLSSDRDLIALVGDEVTLVRPRSSMDDLEVCDPASVRAAYGIWPDRYLELAALRGDTSDNLPGVRGVGAKTAARLLRSWGSIEAIYEGIRDLPPRQAEALRAGREAVERNLELMSPLEGVEVDVAGTLARGVDVARLTSVLKDAGLHVAAAALRRAIELGPPPPLPPPPEEETTDYGRPDRPVRSRRQVIVTAAAVQLGLFD